MKPREIGIVFPSPKSGGVFQFTLSIAESLINYSDPEKFRFTVIHYDGENPAAHLNLKNRAVAFVAIPVKHISFIRKVAHFAGLYFLNSSRLAENSRKTLNGIALDLLIFPTPFTYDFFRGIPYINYTPNLMHNHYPNFPEFALGSRITRNIVYRYFSRHSAIDVTEAEQSVRDMHEFLGTPVEKIRIVPYVPPGYIYKHKNMTLGEARATLKKFNLPEKFIFYPAQFWFHKNHIRLIQALKKIKDDRGAEVALVLVGNAKGRYESIYRELRKKIDGFGIGSQITHLGYVSDEEMVALYKTSVALVNPSLLGPTGIPFIEAILLGVPVVGPNIWAIPQVVGEAGILFDPFDVADIAEHIYKIWTDEGLRQKLIVAGKEKAAQMTLQNYAAAWTKVIEEAFTRIKT